MQDFLTYNELAKKLKVGIDTVRRHVSKMKDELGISPLKRKTSTSKGALVACLSLDDANLFINYFETKDKPDEESFRYSRFGYFYIIQLIPEFDPNRVKIGFADNVDKRLNEHRTSSPTAKLVKFWPCKRSWDQAAMDSITNGNCKLIMNEVYESDIDSFIKRGEEFFAIMPKPDNKIELSRHSPLNEKTLPNTVQLSMFAKRFTLQLHWPLCAIRTKK